MSFQSFDSLQLASPWSRLWLGPCHGPPLLLASLALALALGVIPAAHTILSKPRLLGSLDDADVNEEGMQQVLNFALSGYNKASKDAFNSPTVWVVRAHKQVVAEMIYFLDVGISRNVCTKS
ncbi:cystatin-C-like [Rousettus aegyptiacus]|uniref:cystatin-C-like n=1 Tax=Rousettus aegyptiacus TaxID=9407 RepID=UPI00168CC0B7|nr:cystatin-C-like [Rousettus aegyptiacus]